jgi:hypothetical protein
MKHTFILSLLLVLCFLSAAFADEEPEAENLNGKNVVVRLYNDWHEDLAVFEKVSIQVKGRSIKFDFADVGESAFIVVVGEDQTEAAVKKALGNCIYAQPDKKGLRFSLPHRNSSSQRDYCWIFNDALGNPMAGATVEVYLKAKRGSRVLIGEVVLDKQGLLKIETVAGWFRRFDFVVRHRDYGIAKVRYFYFVGSWPVTVFVPLALERTKADERGIWGTVVDPEGKPVSEALIYCSALRTLAGIWVQSLYGWEYAVITDEHGLFWMYLPIGKDKEKIGGLIPPRTKYKIRVEAPKELGLQPYVAYVPNCSEVTIKMERNDYFHTFAFEDGDDPITDPNTLKRIHINIWQNGEKPKLSFGYDEWKNGGRFPRGTYQARAYGVNGYGFELIEVTEDSPEQLLFKRPEGISYYGWVVNGITGEPMQGVFVIAKSSSYSERNLCLITPAQWDAMHALPINPSPDDPALAALRKKYGFRKIVRTDQNGWFYMTVKPFDGLVAFEENYLGVVDRRYVFRPNKNGEVEVPVIKLFPAARVTIEPLVKTDLAAIKPQCLIDKDNNPGWAAELLAINDAKLTSFTYEECIRKNKRSTFCVPAGLNLLVQLRIISNTRWHPITVDETINLQQGETLDLDSYTFQPALKVFVKVVNSVGEPVEAVPVRNKTGKRYQYPLHSTDPNGMTQFYVLAYSSGEFVVDYYEDKRDPDSVRLRESTAYEVGGEEDAGREFTITISDEMLYQLFK